MSPTSLADDAVRHLTAREYLRVSKDKSGRARSTEEQHADNVKAADSRRWTLGDPYGDVSRSASRYAQREREGFADLVADLEKGAFGADVLVLWEPSRGSRRVSEWVRLLELLEERSVRVHITTHGRTYDPKNHRDRRSLLEDAVDSEYETGKASDRTKRGLAANADAGRPHGKPVLGYRRIYDERTGALLGQEPDPEVAPRIRDMFARLRRGESIRSVMRLWEEAGYRTGKGTVYSHTYITRLARNPQYAGLRLHEAGRVGGQLPSSKARLIEAAWEPIVSREDWYAVQRLLNAPGRRSNREGKAKHWLTMIAVCDVCDGPMVGRKLHGKHWNYGCHAGHLSVRMDGVDELVEGVIVTYLERENVAEESSTLEQDDAALQTVRDEIAELGRRLEEVVEEVSSGAMSPSMGSKIEANVLEQLRAAEAKERELTTPAVLEGLFETGPGAWERWEALTLERRRKIAAAVLVPEILGQVRLRPSKFYREPAEDRVIWRRVPSPTKKE